MAGTLGYDFQIPDDNSMAGYSEMTTPPPLTTRRDDTRRAPVGGFDGEAAGDKSDRLELLEELNEEAEEQ